MRPYRFCTLGLSHHEMSSDKTSEVSSQFLCLFFILFIQQSIQTATRKTTSFPVIVSHTFLLHSKKIYPSVLAHKVLQELFPLYRMIPFIPFVPGCPFHFLHSQVTDSNTYYLLHESAHLDFMPPSDCTWQFLFCHSSIIPYSLACWPFTFSNTHLSICSHIQATSKPVLHCGIASSRGSFSFRLCPNNFTIISKGLIKALLGSHVLYQFISLSW